MRSEWNVSSDAEDDNEAATEFQEVEDEASSSGSSEEGDGVSVSSDSVHEVRSINIDEEIIVSDDDDEDAQDDLNRYQNQQPSDDDDDDVMQVDGAYDDGSSSGDSGDEVEVGDDGNDGEDSQGETVNPSGDGNQGEDDEEAVDDQSEADPTGGGDSDAVTEPGSPEQPPREPEPLAKELDREEAVRQQPASPSRCEQMEEAKRTDEAVEAGFVAVEKEEEEEDVEIDGVRLEFMRQKELLIISLPVEEGEEGLSLLPPGRYILQMEFSGQLDDSMRGFYRTRHRLRDGTERWGAACHFEATGARKCFPCFDQPEFRLAIFEK